MVVLFIPAANVLHTGLQAIFRHLPPTQKSQGHSPSAIPDEFFQRSLRVSLYADAAKFSSLARGDLEIDLHVLRTRPQFGPGLDRGLIKAVSQHRVLDVLYGCFQIAFRKSRTGLQLRGNHQLPRTRRLRNPGHLDPPDKQIELGDKGQPNASGVGRGVHRHLGILAGCKKTLDRVAHNQRIQEISNVHRQQRQQVLSCQRLRRGLEFDADDRLP